MWTIDKICCYAENNFNILPAILLTPQYNGFIIAFKWLNGHLGFRIINTRYTYAY